MRRLTGILFPLLFLGLFGALLFAAFNGGGDPTVSTQVIELAESGREVIVIDSGRRFGVFPFFPLFFGILLLAVAARAMAFRRWAGQAGPSGAGPWRGGHGPCGSRSEQAEDAVPHTAVPDDAVPHDDVPNPPRRS